MLNTHMMTLASKFMTEIKGFPKDAKGRIICPAAYKKEVLQNLGALLNGGTITARQLYDLIEKERDTTDKELYYKPSELCDRHDIPYVLKSYADPSNLLVLGQFYYHTRLQVTPPPPMLIIEDDGTMTASYEDEDFYLEIIDRFTKEDLLQYFYDKTKNRAPKESVYARDIGAFEHMLKFYDVDFILFLIDEAFSYSLDDGGNLPTNPLAIQHFEEQAGVVYEARKRISFEGGLDRVLPRPIA